MKKNFLLLLFILLLFILMGNSQAKMYGVKLKEFPRSSPLRDSLHLQSFNELGDIVILPDSPFNQKEAARIILRLDKLPTSLLEKTKQNGINVKLFTGKLTENPTTSHLAGIVPRGYKTKTWDDVPGIGGGKTVLIKIGASNAGSGHSSVNLELHELAHSIDRYVYHEIRYNKDFLQIWNKEKENLFPGQTYFLTYPEEYLAEAFAYYYMGGRYKEELKKNAPSTFQFIKKLS